MILTIMASFLFDVFIQDKRHFFVNQEIEWDIKLNLWPFGFAVMTCRISGDRAVILKDINILFSYFAICPYWYLFSKNVQWLVFAT